MPLHEMYDEVALNNYLIAAPSKDWAQFSLMVTVSSISNFSQKRIPHQHELSAFYMEHVHDNKNDEQKGR